MNTAINNLSRFLKWEQKIFMMERVSKGLDPGYVLDESVITLRSSTTSVKQGWVNDHCLMISKDKPYQYEHCFSPFSISPLLLVHEQQVGWMIDSNRHIVLRWKGNSQYLKIIIITTMNSHQQQSTSPFVQIWTITLRSFPNDIATLFSPPNASYFLAIIITTRYHKTDINQNTCFIFRFSMLRGEKRGWMIFMDAK